MPLADDRAPARIYITPALPCGMSGCGQLATQAMAEPSPDDPALWQLLPLCDECAAKLQEEARATAMHALER